MLDKIDNFGNGLIVFYPHVFKDNRGYFTETFSENEWNLDVKFVQDNESCSSKNVMRGLHFQTGEFAQAKLVRVIKGKVIDFVLDNRPNSSTYKQMFFVELSEENKAQFFIPRGFAHGFISLEDNTIFSYKCDNYFNKSAEGGFNLLSPSLDIMKNLKNKFGIDNSDNLIILSEKDTKYPFFN